MVLRKPPRQPAAAQTRHIPVYAVCPSRCATPDPRSRFMATLRHSAVLLSLLAAAAPVAAQEFGGSSAVSGREVLIGQPSNLYAPGQVYVFRAGPQGAWSEARSEERRVGKECTPRG